MNSRHFIQVEALEQHAATCAAATFGSWWGKGQCSRNFWWLQFHKPKIPPVTWDLDYFFVLYLTFENAQFWLNCKWQTQGDISLLSTWFIFTHWYCTTLNSALSLKLFCCCCVHLKLFSNDKVSISGDCDWIWMPDIFHSLSHLSISYRQHFTEYHPQRKASDRIAWSMAGQEGQALHALLTVRIINDLN